MPRSNPLISIYLPTRNRSALLTRAVSSVLKQTIQDFELIIVDDCSTDQTGDLCSTICKADLRVRYYRTHQRSGAPYARNLAIREAASPLVTGLDDDDEMLPERLSSLLRHFKPTQSLLCSSAYEKNESWHRLVNAGEAVIDLDELLFDNIVGTQVITLKSRLEAIGGFDETLTASQDYDVWVRLVEKYGPGKRIALPTYIINADNRSDRITVSSKTYASQFLSKHRRIMNPHQIASQEFYTIAARGDQLTFAEWTKVTNRRTWVKTTRYLITSRLPWLRAIARVARRLRSSIGRPL